MVHLDAHYTAVEQMFPAEVVKLRVYLLNRFQRRTFKSSFNILCS